MTGICGAVGTDGRSVGTGFLDGVLDALAAVGPDGTGAWAGEIGSMGVALGAARRTRVTGDLADRQPVTAPGGDLVAVGDVILDNRPELCRALQLADTRDLADSAVVLAAYDRWGDRCAERLLGEFAVAVADGRRGGVWIARDHTGRRPLYLHQGRGWVGFASTALAVTGFPGVPAEIDRQRAREFLALVMASERSWVRAVSLVPAATTTWIDPGGRRRRRYWRVPDGPVTGGSFAEHALARRAALDEAVAARLRRDDAAGPVGVMLSGGLDSTSVAATVARQVGASAVRTYTSVPPPGWVGPDDGRDPDESPLVRALAQRYPNLRPTFLDCRGASLYGGLDQRYAAGATPARNTTNLMWTRALHREAAADGVSTLFTGALGNYAFSADDPGWLGALVRAGRPGEAIRELLAWATRPEARAADAPGMVGAALTRVRRRPRAGREAEWLGATALRPDRHHLVDLHAVLGRPPLAAVIDALSALAEWPTVESAHWRYRVVDPTADVRLLEVCARQPSWVHRHRGRDRAAARAATADRLPDEIRLRTRRGAQLPDVWDRLADARLELAEQLHAARDHPRSRDLIDLDRLHGALADWPAAATAASDRSAWLHVLALPRALAVSGYLRWFEEHARRPRLAPR